MSEETFDANLAGLEKALGKLAPAGSKLTRDRVVYRAGQASMRGRSWKSGALGLVLGLGIALPAAVALQRSFPAPKEVVYVQAPGPEAPLPQESPELSPAELASRKRALNEYLRLEEELSDKGLDALPRPSEPPGDKPNSLEQIIGVS